MTPPGQFDRSRRGQSSQKRVRCFRLTTSSSSSESWVLLTTELCDSRFLRRVEHQSSLQCALAVVKDFAVASRHLLDASPGPRFMGDLYNRQLILLAEFNEAVREAVALQRFSTDWPGAAHCLRMGITRCPAHASESVPDSCLKRGVEFLRHARGGDILVERSLLSDGAPAPAAYRFETFDDGPESGRSFARVRWPMSRACNESSERSLILSHGGTRLKVDASRRRLTLGRGRGTDLQIGAEQASRIHAAVHYDNGNFVLEDLSTHGTQVLLAGHALYLHASKSLLWRDGFIQLGAPVHRDAPASVRFRCVDPRVPPNDTGVDAPGVFSCETQDIARLSEHFTGRSAILLHHTHGLHLHVRVDQVVADSNAGAVHLLIEYQATEGLEDGQVGAGSEKERGSGPWLSAGDALSWTPHQIDAGFNSWTLYFGKETVSDAIKLAATWRRRAIDPLDKHFRYRELAAMLRRRHDTGE